MTKNVSRKATIEERQSKDRQVLLDALREMPIIQVACKRASISRATYYRWRNEDREFRRAVEEAINEGVLFINDMSESQVITLIKEKKMPAITLWLKHNNERYGAKIRSHALVGELLNSADPQYQKHWGELQKVAEEYEQELRKTIIEKIHEN